MYKMAKYGRVAEQNNLRFIPAVFSHTGQIHGEFKALVKEQIRHKLIAFEGEAKCSKIRSVMKWWSKCISMAIAKTASRNVAFKVAKMITNIIGGLLENIDNTSYYVYVDEEDAT